MKILAFSDLHRDVEAANALVASSRSADLVVGCGDYATRGVGAEETLGILVDCTAPVILVHGNHDNPDDIARFCGRFSHFHYLHGNAITLNGVSFTGLGGEVPARSDNDWNATETETFARERLAAAGPTTVLVTHTPPLGTADTQRNGAHEGSVAIRDAAIATQPTLLLCGHIHHAWGAEGHIGQTRVKNLGPTANWFDV